MLLLQHTSLVGYHYRILDSQLQPWLQSWHFCRLSHLIFHNIMNSEHCTAYAGLQYNAVIHSKHNFILSFNKSLKVWWILRGQKPCSCQSVERCQVGLTCEHVCYQLAPATNSLYDIYLYIIYMLFILELISFMTKDNRARITKKKLKAEKLWSLHDLVELI